MANVEQVVYTQSFLLKSRDFMGRVKKIALFFQQERYNPLATFLFFGCILDPKMIGAFHKSKNRHQLNYGIFRLTCTCLSCPEKELNLKN